MGALYGQWCESSIWTVVWELYLDSVVGALIGQWCESSIWTVVWELYLDSGV